MKTKLLMLTLLSPLVLVLIGCDRQAPATTPPADTNAAGEKPMAPVEPPPPAPVPPPTPPNPINPAVTNH
jgi:predicted small lipoprotein YifL